MLSPDGKNRCFGYGAQQELYAHYHDSEWGVPEHNDQKLFEMLILEGAQAGLSWETILKRRPMYREVFYHFDVALVAAMSDTQLETALQNPGIIRNRLKVYATRQNAQVFLRIQQEFGSFDTYLWAYVDGVPLVNTWQQLQDMPSQTPISKAISMDLKKRGMNFVGPTIIYAFMQAVGMVNDHLADCWLKQNPAH